MKIGIIQFSTASAPRLLNRFLEIMRINGIESEYLSPSDPGFWQKVAVCDYILALQGQYRSQLELARAIMPVIEREMGKKCFPNETTAWHYDDKIRQYYLLSPKGFCFIPCHIFFGRDSALAFAETASYPLVFKLRGGAGSSNVRLVRTKKEAGDYIRLMFGKGVNASTLSFGLLSDLQSMGFAKLMRQYRDRLYLYLKHGYFKTEFWGIEKDYVLFQDFYPGNSFDTRITIIGNRAFGFRRFNRPKDFRASGSGLIDWDESQIDLRCVEEAFKVSGHFGFQSMAYDFIYDPDGKPAICEISYTFQDEAVHKCKGYWDRNMVWHEGHQWPQYCMLQDLLGEPGLRSIPE